MNAPSSTVPESAREALARLSAGNRRFLEGQRPEGQVDPDRRTAVATGQSPFAVVLGCADSRVSPEQVFDVGLGDLFVVRVAGGVASPSVLASVEFAVDAFNIPLVVVLGHSRCAAVAAAVATAGGEDLGLTPAIKGLVDHVVDVAGEVIAESEEKNDPAQILSTAVRRNAAASARNLAVNSQSLSEQINAGKLHITPAHYSLDSGAVEFPEVL